MGMYRLCFVLPLVMRMLSGASLWTIIKIILIYYGLNINSQGDGISRWGLGGIIRFRQGPEDGALMMELVSLQEETRELACSVSL